MAVGVNKPMTVGDVIKKLQEFDPSHRVLFRGKNANSDFMLNKIGKFKVENGCIYYKNSPKPLEKYTAVVIEIT